MKAQRDKILNELPRHGWTVVQLEDYELEWWTDEIWRLESTWSPIGNLAYITFLVDPEVHSLTRKKGESVWAVRVASHKQSAPYKGDGEEGLEISLKQGWEKKLPNFFAHLDKIRNGEFEK